MDFLNNNNNNKRITKWQLFFRVKNQNNQLEFFAWLIIIGLTCVLVIDYWSSLFGLSSIIIDNNRLIDRTLFIDGLAEIHRSIDPSKKPKKYWPQNQKNDHYSHQDSINPFWFDWIWSVKQTNIIFHHQTINKKL